VSNYIQHIHDERGIEACLFQGTEEIGGKVESIITSPTFVSHLQICSKKSPFRGAKSKSMAAHRRRT
jgi:hypothetical protein